MPELNPDFKAELIAAANANLRRHFQRMDDELKTQAQALPPPSEETLTSFKAHLKSSRRILALFGAGLSAASGIPTYRGPGGFWRTYSDQQLSTPGAFRSDPCLVWQFYEHRRRQALAAEPNAAHVALARLAGIKEGFLVVNQNVDELCKRAGHPANQIINFHGSLFRVRCVDNICGYEADDFNSPIVPAMQQPEPGSEHDPMSSRIPLKEDLNVEDLPHCQKCKNNLLRPAVIWFGEGVPESRAARVDQWLGEIDHDERSVDLMLVVGTSAMVRPAAGYITEARKRGARVAFFNTEVKSAGIARPDEGDWVFLGDASELVPLALNGVLDEDLGM